MESHARLFAEAIYLKHRKRTYVTTQLKARSAHLVITMPIPGFRLHKWVQNPGRSKTYVPKFGKMQRDGRLLVVLILDGHVSCAGLVGQTKQWVGWQASSQQRIEHKSRFGLGYLVHFVISS